MLDLSDRSRIERAICSALADAIHAHGSVMLENRSSAAKRIYNLLRQTAKQMEELKEIIRRRREQ